MHVFMAIGGIVLLYALIVVVAAGCDSKWGLPIWCLAILVTTVYLLMGKGFIYGFILWPFVQRKMRVALYWKQQLVGIGFLEDEVSYFSGLRSPSTQQRITQLHATNHNFILLQHHYQQYQQRLLRYSIEGAILWSSFGFLLQMGISQIHIMSVLVAYAIVVLFVRQQLRYSADLPAVQPTLD
jgi:hypothetical protein